MKEVWPSMILAFPAALYVGGFVLGSVAPGDLAFSGMFVVMALLAVVSTFPYEPIRLWASIGLFASIGVTLLALFLAMGTGVDLLAGSLLASPVLLVSYSVRPGSLGWRLMAFAVALTEGLGLLASDTALTAPGIVVSGAAFVHEFVALNLTQATGLGGLLMSTGGALPLRDFFDPVFVILASIAAAGILIPALRPQTAWGEALPAAGAPSSLSPTTGEAVVLDPDIEAALEDRSEPGSATQGLPPGFSSLIYGSAAAALVVGVATVDPGLSLGTLVAVVVTAFGASMALLRRPLRERR